MNIWENMLIEFPDDEGHHSSILRVLWIDPSLTDTVTIDINDPRAFPIWQKISDLEAALCGEKARYLETDPYAYLYLPDSTISEVHLQLRDKAWAIIAPIIESGVQAFFPSERGQSINQIMERTGSTKPTIYKYLRMYWQRGQKLNALLPRYDNCGGKGKPRSGAMKLGRPSKQSQLKGKHPGINVNDQIRLIIIQNAKKFHEKQKLPLKESHQKMLEESFSQTVTDREGFKIPLLLPQEQCPTLRQFCYWYYKERDLEKALINREGQRRYNLKYRDITGALTETASFPGALWQIDSTIADIYLVSSLDRSRIIGRPVLYLVVDVFSRLIVGFSVSLEGPSWLGASLALLNATTNKVNFCQEFGISITADDWPSEHLCKRLQTDRGSEYISRNAREALKTLNIELSLTPAYRPDWKPVVERLFRTINDGFIHWEPGAVHKTRERGDADYRLEAIYTLNEFRKMMIRRILYYNNSHLLQDYPLTKEMIEDRVMACPRQLWEWGIFNCGRPRKESPEIIQLNLLHRGEATVTRQGICFKPAIVNIRNRLRYTCELAMREQWFIKAGIQGTWRVPIAYDPRNPQLIYLLLEGGKRIESCHLLPASKTFADSSLEEVLDHFAEQSLAFQKAQPQEKQEKAVLNAQLAQDREEAREKTEKARQGMSQPSLIKNIREARKEERQHERLQSIGSQTNTTFTTPIGQVIPLPTIVATDEDDGEYIAPHRPFNKLRQLQTRNIDDE